MALQRAQQQCEEDRLRRDLMDIDDKLVEITNSIRQRKRPSEHIISLGKLMSSMSHASTNGNHENEAWRKGRRQSTLRIYDELARLVELRLQFEKQLINIECNSQS
jgi:hypothetical protein